MPTPVNISTPPPPAPEDGIGDRIRQAREMRGLSQSQLHQRTKEADPAGKGIARTVLVGYEAGKFKPGARELRVLCDTLSLSVDWLLLGKKDEGELEQVHAALFAGLGEVDFAALFRLALVFSLLKRHERDALASLLHGLATARKGAADIQSLEHLASLMAHDAELRLTELTESREAARDLLFHSGKDVIEHFSRLYEAAYAERWGANT